MLAITVGLSVFLIIYAFAPLSRLDRRLIVRNKHTSIKESIKELQTQILHVGESFYRKFLSKYKPFQNMHDEFDDLLKKNWMHDQNAAAIVGLNMIISGILIGFGVLSTNPIAFMLGLVSIFAYRMHLRNKWKKRRAEMAKEVLMLAELTAVGVSAGLPPLEALAFAVEGRNTPLAQEVNETVQRIRLNVPASKALMDLSNRINLQEMHAFIDQLITAIETGAKGFSESVIEIVRHLREIRQAQIEETVEKTQAKLLMPLLMFFAAIVCFLLGPLALTFVEVF